MLRIQDNNDNMIKLLKYMQEYSLPVGAIFLGEELQIAQATVGRMLAQLEKDGYIKKVKNKGRIVTSKGDKYLLEYDRQMQRKKTVNSLLRIYDELPKEKLLEILDIRMLIEVKTAELACINGTDEEMQELEKTFLEWKLEILADRLGTEQDLALHLLIARMSRNNTLYSICELLLTQENAYAKFSGMLDNLKTIQMQQHENIVEMIKKRDAEAAKTAMYQHLELVSEGVRNN